jgi:hypothetical protein
LGDTERPANTDDDTYVFWYRTPHAESPAAFAALVTGWLEAGVVPRQGTPFEVAARAPDGSVVVRQLPPPRTGQDVAKLVGGAGSAARLQSVRAQVDLHLAGSTLRARAEFEYAGDDELEPPRVDPRRPFMMGTLVLPRNWRDAIQGAAGDDAAARASAAEDALADRYLLAIASRTGPITGLAGPEHDAVRWRYTAAALAGDPPPRLSDLARYASYLSPEQVGALGAGNLERLKRVFAWVHEMQPRLAPYCRTTEAGGAVLARWPGALDQEPRFVALLTPQDRDAFNAVRAALLGSR